MRISTAQMYQSTSASITSKQADLARLQDQLSTGKRIAHLADDPAAAANASSLRSDLAANTQFEQNRQIANQRLSFSENTLGTVVDTLQSVREMLVGAGNGGLSDADRQTFAGQLKESLDTLVGLANTSDGEGGYLFGGFRQDAPPFVATANTVTYVGDDGARTINVSPTRSVVTAYAGADVFSRIPDGNGVFTTAAGAANTGTGTIDAGHVANAAALTGDSYEIRFQAGGSGTTYDIWDATSSTMISSGTAYTAPAAIALPGMSVRIDGNPAAGDKFEVAPSGTQDIFTTLREAINVLAAPTLGNVTKVSNGLRTALTNLDQALTHVSDVRGTAGARMNELDRLGTLGSARDVDIQGTLSKLEDVDYVQAISDFTVGQQGLQAALSTYSKIAKTTLFDYIR